MNNRSEGQETQAAKIENPEPQIDKIEGWEFDGGGGKSELRQGDLIEFNDTEDPLRQAGIVITADCDLTQRKFARRVSLVPVITLKTLLEQYLLIEHLDLIKGQIEGFAFKGFRISNKLERGDKRARLVAALAESKPEPNNPVHIASHFVLGEKSYLTIDEYRILTTASDRVPAAATDKLSGRAADRGDILHLPDPSKLGITGSVVWLRDIWQVTHEEIATNNFDAQKLGGQKVARLASPYRYRLTQMLGQVFADIGLPDLDKKMIEAAITEAMNDA